MKRFIKTKLMLMHYALIIILAVLMYVAIGCSSETRSEFEEGLRLYNQNLLDEALPHFEQAAKRQPDNPEILAWLAETCRRLDRKDNAINTAYKALKIDTCQAFAHAVLGAVYNPMYGEWEKANPDSGWSHLLKAVACDPNDGNTWIWIWPEAIRRGDRKLELVALRRTYTSEFFSPALLAFNRWVLQYLPENAILITNGDMDTYPALAVQVNENFRTDVVIVNRSLLNTDWYARYIRDIQGVPLAFTDSELEAVKIYKDDNSKVITISDQIINGWLDKSNQGEFNRPIAFAMTVSDLDFVKDAGDHIRLMGVQAVVSGTDSVAE